jgi:hypothetical protein
MPDLIRHPENSKLWIPAFAGMTLREHIYVFYYNSFFLKDDEPEKNYQQKNTLKSSPTETGQMDLLRVRQGRKIL